jgi:hypothetical protein
MARSKASNNLRGKKISQSFLDRIKGKVFGIKPSFKYFISIQIGEVVRQLSFVTKTEELSISKIKVGIKKTTRTNAGNSESNDELRLVISGDDFSCSVFIPPSCFKMNNDDNKQGGDELKFIYTISDPIIVKSSCDRLNKVIAVKKIPTIKQRIVIGQNSPF